MPKNLMTTAEAAKFYNEKLGTDFTAITLYQLAKTHEGLLGEKIDGHWYFSKKEYQ